MAHKTKFRFSLLFSAMTASAIASPAIAVTCASGTYNNSSGHTYTLSSACSATAGNELVVESGSTITLNMTDTEPGAGVGTDGSSVANFGALKAVDVSTGMIINNGDIIVQPNPDVTNTGSTIGRGIVISNTTTNSASSMSITGIINADNASITVYGHGIEIGYTGGVTVTGFTASDYGIDYSDTLAIYNGGSITTTNDGTGISITHGTQVNGDVYNNGSISAGGAAISVATTKTKINGSIVNDGTIESRGSDGILNKGTITGSIKNNEGAKIEAAGSGINNTGTISGDIANSGTISGSLTAGINNAGTINGQISNSSTGEISSTAGSGIINSGTISSDITNAGLISGAASGISNTSTGKINGGITNTNEITGEVSGIDNAGTVKLITNNSGGTISGTGTSGIGITNSGTVSSGIGNAGSITGTVTGISNTGSGSIAGGITNTNTISGGQTGISNAEKATVSGGITNSGTISGNSTAGIGNAGTVDLITNNSGGTIKSTSGSGIVNSGMVSESITNTGTVTGALSGIDNAGTVTLITNNLGGTISGTGTSGVGIANSGTVSSGIGNAGSITGTVTGISNAEKATVSGGITNSGTISGNSTAGIGNAGTVDLITNNSGGTIKSTSGSGIVNSGMVSESITNTGTVTGALSGIDNAGTVTLITNNLGGTISGTGTSGVGIANSGTVSSGIGNAGSITGTVTGISNAEKATVSGGITNSGTISGNSTAGIGNAGTVDLITNNSGGTIKSTSSSGIVNSGMVSESITNTGTVTGALSGIDNSGTVKLITNNLGGTISGTGTSGIGIANSGTVSSGIGNAGSITGTVTGISNTGSISGSSTGIDNTGTISGGLSGYGIDNSGTIEAEDSDSGIGIKNTNIISNIRNTGTISGSGASIDTFAGTVTNGIDNYGTLVGDVKLGANTLNLLGGGTGDALMVEGTITGTVGSVINVSNYADFTASYAAEVDEINVDRDSKLTLEDGIDWAADLSSDSSITNNGTVSLAGDTVTSASLTVGSSGYFYSNGTLDLTGGNTSKMPGSTLTINGDYVSNNGSLVINTLLDDATSNNGVGTSDVLVITGNASTGSAGSTKIYVTGSSDSSGQATVGKGIKVVEVDGTTSSDAFSLGRAVVSGEYEYVLNNYSGDSNWYLSSYTTVDPVTPLPNPAIGAYLSNQTAAVNMFQQTLFDRLVTSPENEGDASKKFSGMRTRVIRGHHDTPGINVSNKTRTYTLQASGDLNVWALKRDDYFHLGVMAGYGDFRDTGRSKITGTETTGKVTGFSAGIYGTYFANKDMDTGLYVDIWSQIGRYRNKVDGEAQNSASIYNSTVWSTSVEAGYGISMITNDKYQWIATPQLQLTYNLYSARDYRDDNNLSLTNHDADGLNTRLGLRVHAKRFDKKGIEPFVEVNWLNTTANNKIDFNGHSYRDGGNGNIAEAKIGIQGKINNHWNAAAQMSGRWGKNDYRYYQGQLTLTRFF